MTFLDHALAAAAAGFRVFALIPGGKTPETEGWQQRATTNLDRVRGMWTDPVLETVQPWNVGIDTTRFGSGALVVVDVDVKDDRPGLGTLLELEMDGCFFPATYTQVTPTGGRHLFYSCPAPLRQGANLLGPGVDIRSRGGLVVAAGSETTKGVYSGDLSVPVAPAPQWLIDRLGVAVERAPKIETELATVNLASVVHYLQKEAPLAVQGCGGDSTTYQVAARVRELGADEGSALQLMLEHWNPRCSPPWSPEDLAVKVKNAKRYSQRAQGAAAPERQFKPDPAAVEKEPRGVDPVRALNQEYAWATVGGTGHVLWETTDEYDRFRLEHLSVDTFHQKLASRIIFEDGGKSRTISREWMKHPDRRSYDGLVFAPGGAPDRFYNLWRGFAFEPAGPDEKFSDLAQDSVKMWREHLEENAALSNAEYARYITAWFAHLIQKPHEKILVALALCSPEKGTGKNALIERVGALLGSHFMVADDPRYLIGNFNGHLENCLLFALDEVCWGGDKKAQGRLQGLITGQSHTIERKGQESYRVRNLTRIALLSNEDWFVPASGDERRYAIFQMGAARQQQTQWFEKMRLGMEAGGYRLLLRYLHDFDLTGIDVNRAPKTRALYEQKLRSLELVHQFWFECLDAGQFVGIDFQNGWPKRLEIESFRDALRLWARKRNVTARLPDERIIGKLMLVCTPSIARVRLSTDGRPWAYQLPELEVARKEWDAWIGPWGEWGE